MDKTIDHQQSEITASTSGASVSSDWPTTAPNGDNNETFEDFSIQENYTPPAKAMEIRMVDVRAVVEDQLEGGWWDQLNTYDRVQLCFLVLRRQHDFLFHFICNINGYMYYRHYV